MVALYYRYFFLLLTLLLSTCQENVVRSEKPNFIFILVDDLGKEWISCYGGQLVKTPNIDRIADQGILFHRAYSMPQCTPSRVALLTGQYPYNNGWINHFDVPRWGHGARFDPELNVSFPKLLQKNGYRTAAAGKWQISDFRLEPDAIVQAGFDDFCMWTGGEGGNEKVSDERYWDPYIHTEEGSKTYVGSFGPDIFTDFIIDFINDHQGSPFFVYYPMVLTHTPLVPTPHKKNATTNFEKHVAMVEYTDHLVGRIYDHLVDKKLDNNTYLIFTTDNGTARSIIGQRYDQYIGGGKAFLTENGINAPFIVASPHYDQGTESDVLLDFTDIAPTLLDLAGISPVGLPFDGLSFAPSLRNEEPQKERSWITSLGSHPAQIDSLGKIKPYHVFRDRIISDDHYKVYVDTVGNIIRIYDLLADSLETTNLIDSVGGEVLTRFDSIVQTMPKVDAAPSYRKIDGSAFDLDIERLNAMSSKAHRINKNMRAPSGKEDLDKFRSRND